MSFKIKFFSGSPLGDINHEPGDGDDSFAASINMAFFMIKHWYDLYGQTSDVEWQWNEYFIFEPVTTYAEKILLDPPNLLALSVFIWNEEYQHTLAKIIKTFSPSTQILMGGPQLVAHKNKKFFDEHPYVDWVVYGDGEKPFQQIVDWLSGADKTKDHWCNIVHNNNRYEIFPFEQLRDEGYFKSSPYLGQKDLIKQYIQYFNSQGIPNRQIILGIEFARGCMYSCSFCDWSQNLTKKVKRRQAAWKEEIDFFRELDVSIRETDANFGQWAEDLEIYDYALSLYDPTRNFKFIAFNTPKLKKDATLHILVNNAKFFKTRIHVVLQDINLDVLQKMDRPSLSWEKHVELINDLKAAIPEQTDLITAQIMVGVAGQTYQSVLETMRKIWDQGIRRFNLSHWLLLPNSPGADPMYQKIHSLEWRRTYMQIAPTPLYAPYGLDSIYDDIFKNTGVRKMFNEGTLIYRTSSMDFVEMIAIKIFSHSLTTRLKQIKSDFHTTKNFDSLWNTLAHKALKNAEAQISPREHMYQKYGFIIDGTWDQTTNQLYRTWFFTN